MKQLKKILVVLGAIVIFVAMTFAAYHYWIYINNGGKII
jgi:hypothetical protein